MTPDEQFVSDMLAKGHGKEAIFAALDQVKRPQRTKTPLMRPDTGGLRGDPDEGDLAPTNPLDSALRSIGPEPSPELARAPDRRTPEQRLRARRDPLFGGEVDSTTGAVGDLAVGGAASKLLGAGLRAIPWVGRALSGASGRAAGLGVGAGVGTAEGAAGVAAAEASKGQVPTLEGALYGMALGATGRGLGGLSAGIRNPLSRTGRAIANIKAVGGRPGLPGERPAVGGMYDEPGYRALPEGDVGTGQMAEGAAGRIRAGNEARMAAAGQGLDTGEAAARGALGKGRINTQAAIDEIDAMASELVANKQAVNPGLIQTLARYRSLLTRPAPSSPPGIPPGPGTPEISFDELRSLIKQANEAAKFGGDPTLKGSYGKRLSGAISNLQRGIAPEMDQALDTYASTARDVSRQNSAVMGKPKARVNPDNDVATARAESRLEDVGKENKAARTNERRMVRRGVDPNELARMRGRNAAESVRFGAPSAGRPKITKESIVAQNLNAGQVRIAEPLGRGLNAVTRPELLPAEARALQEMLGLDTTTPAVPAPPRKTLMERLREAAEARLRPMIRRELEQALPEEDQ